MAQLTVKGVATAPARTSGAFRAAGRLIGSNDLLIAAQASATGATRVTANTDEFGRVRGLQVENWLAHPLV